MPRPRRRIRLREIDARALDPRPSGADARAHPARRRRSRAPASTARRAPASHRWCSRIRIPRSIRASPCAGRWKRRCACMASRRQGEVEDAYRRDPARVSACGRSKRRAIPHEFSGGQRQRIGIARALILSRRSSSLDEPVSALDVSIRAQIINLLLELKETLWLSYIMISHDLGVVEHMSDRVAVMYLGRIVETGDWHTISRPRHPYTRALITAIPGSVQRSRGDKMMGEIPNPLDPPTGAASIRAAPKRGTLPPAAGAGARGGGRGPRGPLPAGPYRRTEARRVASSPDGPYGLAPPVLKPPSPHGPPSDDPRPRPAADSPSHRGRLSIGDWAIPCVVGAGGLVPPRSSARATSAPRSGLSPALRLLRSRAFPDFPRDLAFPFVPFSDDLIWEEDGPTTIGWSSPRRRARRREAGAAARRAPVRGDHSDRLQRRRSEPGRGSAIFIHAARDRSGTAGCIGVAGDRIPDWCGA